MFAVIVPVVPVVMVPGPDGGNNQQVQPMGPGNGAGHGPWNPAGITGNAPGEAWTYANWGQNQNEWQNAGGGAQAWDYAYGHGQADQRQGQTWQGGNDEDAVTTLIQSAKDDQVNSLRALVDLLLAVLADKDAIKDYGAKYPCHLEPLPEDVARVMTRLVNDIVARACHTLKPSAVEDRFKRNPNWWLARELQDLMAQITSECLEKQQQSCRAQFLSGLTKALISLVDSTVYEVSTPPNAIEALIRLVRSRQRYMRYLDEFLRLQMLSLQKIAKAIDLLVELKLRATRATAKRHGQKIRSHVDWMTRTLMTLKGCTWYQNPSSSYKEFLQNLFVSQESISRVMNHAQYYVWNKMQFFWSEAQKEKTRLQVIRQQKAMMRMQTALQGSSVPATATEDASAGDTSTHAEEPAEASYGEGKGDSNATEDFGWWEPPMEGQTESPAKEDFGWWAPPMEGQDQHRIGEPESQDFDWWAPPMEGQDQHRIGEPESQEAKEDGSKNGREDFPRCSTASTEATARQGEAALRWADMYDDEPCDWEGLWKEPDTSRFCIRDT